MYLNEAKAQFWRNFDVDVESIIHSRIQNEFRPRKASKNN